MGEIFDSFIVVFKFALGTGSPIVVGGLFGFKIDRFGKILQGFAVLLELIFGAAPVSEIEPLSLVESYRPGEIFDRIFKGLQVVVRAPSLVVVGGVRLVEIDCLVEIIYGLNVASEAKLGDSLVVVVEGVVGTEEGGFDEIVD